MFNCISTLVIRFQERFQYSNNSLHILVFLGVLLWVDDFYSPFHVHFLMIFKRLFFSGFLQLQKKTIRITVIFQFHNLFISCADSRLYFIYFLLTCLFKVRNRLSVNVVFFFSHKEGLTAVHCICWLNLIHEVIYWLVYICCGRIEYVCIVPSL